MLRVLLLASLLACGLGAGALRPRPRLDGRIVGGQPVPIDQFPFVVQFEYAGSLRCGGSIISPDWVVTAAHCVDGISATNVQFRAGSSNRGSDGSLHQALILIANPLYDDYTIDFDVAVARVSPPFTFGSGVGPIALATVEPPAGATATTLGWGTTSPGGSLSSVLRAVDVLITDRAVCNAAYADYGGITVNMICAGVPEGGKDACQGDSGGPLIVGVELVGIVSWGLSCALADYPGVYSNVYSLKGFITEQTGVA